MEQQYVQRESRITGNVCQQRAKFGRVIADYRTERLLQAKKAIEEGKQQAPPEMTKMKKLDSHAHKHEMEVDTRKAFAAHGLALEEDTLLPFLKKSQVVKSDGYYNIYLGDSENSKKAIFMGYQVDESEAELKHAGPFGVERTAQL